MPTAIDLSNLFLRRQAESRSLSAENFRAGKGAGGVATVQTSLNPAVAVRASELGQGWKVCPCLAVPAGETLTLMDQEGPGVIRHIWMTLDVKFHRQLILRIYWDGEKTPAVECPIGDFMCQSWKRDQAITALPVNVNPRGGMNSFFAMPFGRHARITVENDTRNALPELYYTINYTLEPLPADCVYFHAQFRRTNPVRYKDVYTLLDGVEGHGHYVGAFMSWQQNHAGWWGEGEIKMYLDGDRDFPTICGTGTEDYFGGAWNFGATNFSAPYFGFLQVTGQSEQAGARMTMYRFHVHDPVFFKANLRITMQALGWREGGKFLPLQDDIASVVYWYQTLPTAPFPVLPERDAREII